MGDNWLLTLLLVVGTLLNIAICVIHVVVVYAARKKSGTSQRVSGCIYCCQYNANFPVAVLSQYCSSSKTDLNQNTPTPAAGHTEHVQMEGQAGQGDPMYEDILPPSRDTGVAIELEKNIAYSTTTVTRM